MHTEYGARLHIKQARYEAKAYRRIADVEFLLSDVRDVYTRCINSTVVGDRFLEFALPHARFYAIVTFFRYER